MINENYTHYKCYVRNKSIHHFANAIVEGSVSVIVPIEE